MAALYFDNEKEGDDVRYTDKKRREPWIKRGATFHEVKTSHQDCLYRAERNCDPDIMPVIDRMAKNFEPLER